MRILVVDDVRALALLVKQMLENGGHTVEVAYGGDEAIATAKAFMPELVICDLNLDVGPNGFDVARALKASPDTQTAYLVALTGYDDEAERQEAASAGFTAHLAKPVSYDALTDIVAEAERSMRPM